MVRIRGLNGVRAICAIYVLLSHVEQELVFTYGGQMNVFTVSSYAVTVFFTVSGFLITHQLLYERKATGVVNIKGFYLRRCLRILPLYFLYIFLALGCLLFFGKAISFETLIYFILPLANIPFIFQIQVPLISHLWSIGVEEQFYLFWPWVILSIKKLDFFIFVFIIVFLGIKIFIWISEYTWNNKFLYAMQVTRFDCIAIGSLGALIFQKNDKRFRKVILFPFVQLLIYFTVLALIFGSFHLADVINHEVIAIISVGLIFCIHHYKWSFINMQNRWIDYIGSISYGIYMYHPLIIFLIFTLLKKIVSIREAGVDMLVYLLITVITVIIAGLSYTFFEKQFLLKKIKQKQIL